jgi:alkylated DNA repair dioxygenase AlkB
MTFIADSDMAAGYRYFCIYSDKSGKELVKALGLCSGDVLVMQGGFQREFWHAVPKTARRDFALQRRINITFRAWGHVN